MNIIEIESEPKGDSYNSLINLAFEICDEFILVIRDNIDLNEVGKTILKELAPALKEIKEQNEWPGTRLLEHTATVYHYKTDKSIKDILIDKIEGLYSWLQPNYPEDLCFIKKEGKTWVGTVSHEKMCWIECETNEELQKIKEIKGLKFEVINIKI